MTYNELKISGFERAIDFDEFVKYCSLEMKINQKSLVGKNRHWDEIDKRVIMYKVLSLNGYSQQEIADKTGKDRSTISHHLAKFKNVFLIELHAEYQKFINKLLKSKLWKSSVQRFVFGK